MRSEVSPTAEKTATESIAANTSQPKTLAMFRSCFIASSSIVVFAAIAKPPQHPSQIARFPFHELFVPRPIGGVT